MPISELAMHYALPSSFVGGGGWGGGGRGVEGNFVLGFPQTIRFYIELRISVMSDFVYVSTLRAYGVCGQKSSKK